MKFLPLWSKTTNTNRTYWMQKLDNALWMSFTTFKTTIGMPLYQIVFCKACHLPMKLEYKTFSTLKKLNLSWMNFDLGHMREQFSIRKE